MARGRKDDKPPKLSKSERRRQKREAKEAARKQPRTAVDVPVEKRPIPGPTVERDPSARIMFRLSLMDTTGLGRSPNLQATTFG